MAATPPVGTCNDLPTSQNVILFDLQWTNSTLHHHDADESNVCERHEEAAAENSIQNILGVFSCQTWSEDRTVLVCQFTAKQPQYQPIYDNFNWKESALLFAVDKLFTLLDADGYKRFKFMELDHDVANDAVLIRLRPKSDANPSVVELYKMVYFVLFYHIQINLYTPKCVERDTGVRYGAPSTGSAIASLPPRDGSATVPEVFDDEMAINDKKEYLHHQNGSDDLHNMEFNDDYIEEPEVNLLNESKKSFKHQSAVWDEMLSQVQSHNDKSPNIVDEEQYGDDYNDIEDSNSDTSLEFIENELNDLDTLVALKRDVLMDRLSPFQVFTTIEDILIECRLDYMHLLNTTHDMVHGTNEELMAGVKSISKNMIVGTIFQILDLLSISDSVKMSEFTYNSLLKYSKFMNQHDIEKKHQTFYIVILYLKSNNITLYALFKSQPALAEELGHSISRFVKQETQENFKTLSKTIEKIERSITNLL